MSNISGGVNEEAVNGPIDSADETISLSELPIDSADRTISLNQLGVERGVIPEEPTESPGAEGPRLPQTFAELSKQLGQRSEETEFLDLEAMGFDKVTRQDLQGLDGVAGDRPGFFDALGDTGAEDLPFVGVVPQAKELFELQQAGAAHQIGDSSREQQLLLLRARARAAQDPTFAGGVADFLVGFGTTGVEIGTSFGVGAATKVTAKTGLRLARKELLDQITEQSTRTAVRRVTKKVVEGAGLAGTTATLQEVVPRFFHEDGVIRGDGSARGAWTLNHARRAFAEWDMTDEEAQLLATIANENLADFLDAKVDRWKGFQESFIQNAAEQTGGAIARIPGISYLQAVQARTFQRIAGSVAKEEGIERILGAVTAKGAAKVAQFDGPLGEVLEEVVSGMAVEGLLGESFIDGLPDSIEQAAQLFAAAAFFPGGRAVLNRARNEVRMRLPSRQREAQEQAQADAATVPAEEGAPGSQSRVEPGASPQNGGEQISPGEATAETAGVEPGVSLAEPESVQEFAKSAGLEEATPIEPQTPDQAAAVNLARGLGREIVLVSSPSEARNSGMIDEQGRMFVHAEAASPLGVAAHELAHDLRDRLGEDGFRAELENVERIAPGFVDRYTRRWRRIADTSQVDINNPDLAVEEGFASLVEEYAALVSYASQPQGARDLAVVAQSSPTIFRRLIDGVRRLVGKVDPEGTTAALDRIETATRQRPDQAAAQLSSYLADLYQRTLAVDPNASGQIEVQSVQPTAQVASPTQASQGSLEEASSARRAPRTVAASAILQAPNTAAPAAPISSQSGEALASSLPPSDTSAPETITSRDTAENLPDIPRPDLNNPLDSAEGRAVLDAVDGARSSQGLPAPVSIAEQRAFAEEQLQRDYDGTRSEIEAKLETGELLSAWETHAAVDILNGLTFDGLRGVDGAMADAVRLGEAYRAVRSETARALGTTRGRGQSAQERVIDMLTLPTRSNLRKRRKIQKEVDGIMRLVSPFKSDRARFLRTRHQDEQERRGKRFAPNRELKFAPGTLDEAGKPLTEARLEFLTKKLEEIEADEARRMEKAGQALRNMGFDIDALSVEDILDPNDGWKIRNVISVAKSTKTDKLLEYRYMSMLSGVKTHVANMTGNAAQLFLEGPAQKAAEGVVNLFVRDERSASIGELQWWFRGFLGSVRPAFRNLVNAYRTEGPAWELDLERRGVEMGDYGSALGSRLDFVPGPKIGSRVARGLRHLSLNTLQAGDEFIKTIAGTAELWSLAYREASAEGLRGKEREVRALALMDDTSSNIWTQSLYKARQVTFQDEGGRGSQFASEIVGNLVGGLDNIGETYTRVPVGTVLIPFRRTPIRIAATALRRSPLQSAMIPMKAISGEYRGKKDALVRDLADAVVAWGLTMAIWELVSLEDDEGLPFITGSRSDNAGENALSFRNAPPMSIRLDGEYHDYGRIEPFATSVGLLVGMVQKYEQEGTMESFQGLMAAAADQSKDKTFLRNIGEIMELADSRRAGKDRIAKFMRDTLVTPLVPNIIRQIARESDDVLRERRTREQGELAFWLDGIMSTSADPLAKLAGSEPRRQRYDAWGRVIKRPHARRGGTDLIFRLLNPLPPRQSVDDVSRIDLALLNWKTRVTQGEVEDGKPYFIGRPSSRFIIDKQSFTMTPSEYDSYVRTSGQAAAKAILADTEINLDEPSQADIDRIRKHVNKQRREARDKVKEQRMAAQ